MYSAIGVEHALYVGLTNKGRLLFRRPTKAKRYGRQVVLITKLQHLLYCLKLKLLNLELHLLLKMLYGKFNRRLY